MKKINRVFSSRRICGALGDPTDESPEGGGTINTSVLPGKLSNGPN